MLCTYSLSETDRTPLRFINPGVPADRGRLSADLSNEAGKGRFNKTPTRSGDDSGQSHVEMVSLGSALDAGHRFAQLRRLGLR